MSLNKKSINDLFRKLVEIENFIQKYNTENKINSTERISLNIKNYIQDIIKLYLKTEEIIASLHILKKIKKTNTVDLSISQKIEYKSHDISNPEKINTKILIDMNNNITDYLNDLYKQDNLSNSHKNLYKIIHDFKILLPFIELQKIKLVNIGNTISNKYNIGNPNSTLQTIAFVKLLEKNSIKSLKKILPETVFHTITLKYKGGKKNNKSRKNKK